MMRTMERERSTLRGFCFGMLLMAVLFRLAAAVQWDRLTVRDVPTETAVSVAPTAEYPTLLYVPEPTVPIGAEVTVDNACGAQFDMQALLAESLPLKKSGEPTVLIVHTHATEAYTPTEGAQYTASSAYRTEDTAYNVVRVGQALCDGLNANGIVTLHDTSLNDLAGYDGAYERMAETIRAYLDEYPSLQMVIDVHRDAAVDANGQQVAVTTELRGEEYARLMLVMGTELSGLEHPNWQRNLACALRLQSIGEARAAGLFRALTLRAGRYNEHLTDCSMLVEVGTAGNTLPQALRSAELLAELLTELFS